MAVSYQGKTLHIPQWRIELQTLCNGLEEDLGKLCGTGEDMSIQIPADAMDNWTDPTRGYSWLKNGSFLAQERPLMKKLLHDEDLRLGAVGRDEQLIIHKGVALSVLRQTAAINRKLSLLSFLTPGQTPRMAEFADHKHANSTRPRTMFRAHGDIWLVTRRVKYENLIRRDVFIPIKVHPRLQKLLEQYFLIVRPLEEDLAEMIYGPETAKLYSEFMWVEMGRLVSSDNFSEHLQAFLGPCCSAPIHGKAYRQVAVEIARIFLGSQHEILQDEDEDDILAAQRGHNLSTSRRSYALEIGHLPSMSSDTLRQFGRISEAWWEVVGFKTGCPPLLPLSRRRKAARTAATVPSGDVAGLLDLGSDDLLDHITATVASEVQKAQATLLKEIQKVVAAGIVAAMGQMSTVRPSTNNPPVLKNPVVPLFQHPPLPPLPQLPLSRSPSPLPQFSLSRPPSLPPQLSLANLPAPHVMVDPTIAAPTIQSTSLQLLRQCYPDKPDVAFLSAEQQLIVETALLRQESFVGILPTGGGKSLAYLLPALQNTGRVIFVITPNKMLLRDQLNRAKTLGIDAVQWTANTSLSHRPRLIFLALETAVSKAFEVYVMRFCDLFFSYTYSDVSSFWLLYDGCVDALYVDECHQALSAKEYRPQFGKLRELAKREVPKVFLTASLPLRLEREFFLLTGMPRTTRIIRAKVPQPQLRYHILSTEPATTNATRLVIDLTRMLTSKYLDKDRRGIIFCPSKAEVNLYAAAITHCKSHSEMGVDQRMLNEQDWYWGRKQWIAATTGLIHGIDVAMVGAVIFTDLPYGLLNVYQGAGRAGRNGQAADIFILKQGNIHHITGKRDLHSPDYECRTEGVQWLNEKDVCRRVGFSLLLDGCETTCGDLPNGQLCDVCDPHSRLLAAAKALIPDPPPPCPTSSFSQELVGPGPLFNIQSNKRSRPEDDYDQFNTDVNDHLYSQVEMPVAKAPRLSGLSGIPSHVGRSFGHQRTVSLPVNGVGGFQSARLVPRSSLVAASVPIGVHLERQEMVMMNEVKKTTADLMEKMAASLLTHCVPCWAWKSVLTQKDPEHKTYRDCRGEDSFCEWGIGWQDFKKKIRLELYKYCFRCGLPQDGYRPTAHPKFQIGKRMQCPLEDTVAHILWIIRHVPENWRRAVGVFEERGLRLEMDTTQFAHWAAIESGADRFYNGLEVAVWFWTIREGFN